MFGFSKKVKREEIMDIKRGDVFSTYGLKDIYYLVMSNNNMNRYASRIGVIPITNLDMSMAQFQTNIKHQMIIDKSELKERISVVSNEKLREIDDFIIEFGSTDYLPK